MKQNCFDESIDDETKDKAELERGGDERRIPSVTKIADDEALLDERERPSK